MPALSAVQPHVHTQVPGAARIDHYGVAMKDPEGNEFDIN